ncbi:MAG TPA: hypothetical protein VF584_18755 [Longimicrobium sp.]
MAAAKDAAGGAGRDDRVRVIPASELGSNFAQHLRELENSLENRRAEQAAECLAQIAKDAPLRIGFAEGPLPDGAVAAVVRDPTGVAKRAFIFSESTISSRAISLARIALDEDEFAHLEISSARVLFVTADQRVRLGNQIRQMDYTIPERGPSEATYLLRAKRTDTVQIPEIGRARMLEVNP